MLLTGSCQDNQVSDRLINYAKISPLDPEQGIILGRFNFQGRKEIYDHGAGHMIFYTNYVVPHIISIIFPKGLKF